MITYWHSCGRLARVITVINSLTDQQQRQDVGELAVGGEERVGAELLPVGRLPGGCRVAGAAFHAASEDPRLFHVMLVRLVATRVYAVLFGMKICELHQIIQK